MNSVSTAMNSDRARRAHRSASSSVVVISGCIFIGARLAERQATNNALRLLGFRAAAEQATVGESGRFRGIYPQVCGARPAAGIAAAVRTPGADWHRVALGGPVRTPTFAAVLVRESAVRRVRSLRHKP